MLAPISHKQLLPFGASDPYVFSVWLPDELGFPKMSHDFIRYGIQVHGFDFLSHEGSLPKSVRQSLSNRPD
jgi:hypothetical protein